ncbi:MAG: hypothetical protein ABIC68_03210 [Candidatus Omnitrophota bacterium]
MKRGVLRGEYRKKFNNRNVSAFLFRGSHLIQLRRFLDEKSKLLEKLQSRHRKKDLDFGSVVLCEDLPELLAQVKKYTDDFLELKRVSLPKILPYHVFSLSTSYLPLLFCLSGIIVAAAGLLLWYHFRSFWPGFIFGTGMLFLGYRMVSGALMYSRKIASTYSYSPLTQTIIVPVKNGVYGRRAELIHILAHEYAHHIQNVFGFGNLFSKRKSIFKEGFAIGLQRYIAQDYACRENNDAFLYGMLDEEVGALQGVYVWLSKQLHVPFAKRQKWLKTTRRPFEPGLKSYAKSPSAHALGYVLFLLLESEQGVQIYSDILRGKFEFGK